MSEVTEVRDLPAPTSAQSEAPDFCLRDQNNEEVTLSQFRGSKSVFVVFYPFAFTGICTGELRVLNDRLDVFAGANTQVLAISCDSPYSLKIFSQRDHFDFPMLSDFWPHGAVARSFGVFNAAVGAANRGTFLIDASGIVRFSECNEMGQGRDPDRWVDEVTRLAARD